MNESMNQWINESMNQWMNMGFEHRALKFDSFVIPQAYKRIQEVMLLRIFIHSNIAKVTQLLKITKYD